MLRIEPTTSTIDNFKSIGKKHLEQNKMPPRNGDKSMLAGTLVGLAAIAAGTVFLVKTPVKSYDEALKKAGVQIKDNVAVLIESGEKFTGKIQRFENRNRRETVKFVDGIIIEKLYHNILGKEIEGEFYKEGKKVLKIWQSVGQVKGTHGYRYHQEGAELIEDGNFIKTKEGFDWARKFVKNLK